MTDWAEIIYKEVKSKLNVNFSQNNGFGTQYAKMVHQNQLVQLFLGS